MSDENKYFDCDTDALKRQDTEKREKHGTYVIETLGEIGDTCNTLKDSIQMCRKLMTDYLNTLDCRLDENFTVPVELDCISSLLNYLDSKIDYIELSSADCVKDFRIAMTGHK